jgi:hypothetical protein
MGGVGKKLVSKSIPNGFQFDGWGWKKWVSKSNPQWSAICMWPCTLKLDEEKSKHAGLAEQNGLCPAVLQTFAEAGERHSKPVHTCERRV